MVKKFWMILNVEARKMNRSVVEILDTYNLVPLDCLLKQYEILAVA